MSFKKVTFLQTKNYDIFHKLPFNREVDKSHVNELVESMKKYGFKGVIQVIETSFIDGELKLYNLDGQHRVAAARIAGVPVSFELTKCGTKKETVEMISILNNSSKAWGTTTFLNVWSSLGVDAYVKMKEMMKKTQLQITPLVMAFTGSARMVEFRKGEMTMPNEAETRKVIKQLLELNQYLPTKAYCRRAIISVMRMEGYNHSKMMKEVKSYSKLLDFPESELPLREELIKLLNNFATKKAA